MLVIAFASVTTSLSSTAMGIQCRVCRNAFEITVISATSPLWTTFRSAATLTGDARTIWGTCKIASAIVSTFACKKTPRNTSNASVKKREPGAVNSPRASMASCPTILRTILILPDPGTFSISVASPTLSRDLAKTTLRIVFLSRILSTLLAISDVRAVIAAIPNLALWSDALLTMLSFRSWLSRKTRLSIPASSTNKTASLVNPAAARPKK
mmetsp:Transcript_7248/g.11114  ORF Transcript_7248/g.11114 Transcript_7248/m.11114 type:complete len:212 (-) Transcript_7248:460-1095(-)